MSSFEIEGYLSELFSNFGDIESISISKFSNDDQKKIQSTRFAHIKFKNKRVKKVLTSSDEFYNSIIPGIVTNWGLSKNGSLKRTRNEILEDYVLSDTNSSTLQEEVDSFMIDFEEQEQVFHLCMKSSKYNNTNTM
jgi:hypothetical protein